MHHEQEQILDQQNNWTNYQKLVMAELTRHDAGIEEVKEQIMELRLELAKFTIELRQEAAGTATLAGRVSERERAANEANVDVTLLKYKIGMIATAVSAALTLAVELVIKYLSKSN